MKIKPTYVSFEQAKWLKEKGYKQTPNKLHNSYYNYKGEFRGDVSDYIKAYVDEDKEKIEEYSSVNAPEQWQVVEWLRINHGIWVRCNSMDGIKWYCDIWNFKGKPNTALTKKAQIIFSDKEYNAPQEAYSSAFDYIKQNNLI